MPLPNKNDEDNIFLVGTKALGSEYIFCSQVKTKIYEEPPKGKPIL